MRKEDATDVREAVILMAGAGSRLGQAGGASAKPLVQVGGRALLSYSLTALARAGVRRVHAVMGAMSARLTSEVEELLPQGMILNAIVNSEWRKQNGVSVLAAEAHVQPPFFLVMGDHLYEFAILAALLEQGDRNRVNLAIDRKIGSIFDLGDAMKVQTSGDTVRAIAKDLQVYDAIDTGVFLCSGDVFDALRRVEHERGDCSLADGVRLLAREGKMRVVDVKDAWWQDVDTPAMLARAEQESARFLWKDRRGLPQERVSRQG